MHLTGWRIDPRRQLVGPGSTLAPAGRTGWIDSLRVAVIAGVIVLHAATAYILDIDWYYQERTTSTATRLLGEDTNGRDGWTQVWRYPGEPLTAHLTIRAIGPGGTSPDTVLGLYHLDPIS